jgi:hypothetical protein
MSKQNNVVQEKTMSQTNAKNSRRNERGAALLIAIFSLLLISAVAIALILMAGTESSISANYKSSLQAFYNAKAGVEEGRGRLWSGNANPLSASSFPGFLPIGQIWYITNPAGSETVDPKTSGNTYADTEYTTEWPSTTITFQPYVTSLASLSGTANAPYKWVRITATTEKSLNLDVNNDGTKDNTNALCFDGSQMLAGTSSACPSGSYQVFTVASLAVTPSGGQRLEEYTVAQTSLNLNFPSALTLASAVTTFSGAASNQYYVNGNDGQGSAPAIAGCTPNAAAKPSIGVTEVSGTTNLTAVNAGIPSNRDDHYTGLGATSPNVADVSLTTSLQTPATLNQLVTKITQTADVVISGNATDANLPSMSASNPKTIVVDGNLTLSGNETGYGLLVVTGNFSYNGNIGWNGIILVVGDGTTTYTGAGGGNGEFDGAIFAATIKDSLGNVLSSFGNVTYDISGGGGNGVYYNSCWVSKAQQSAGLKILSFKEIAN